MNRLFFSACPTHLTTTIHNRNILQTLEQPTHSQKRFIFNLYIFLTRFLKIAS